MHNVDFKPFLRASLGGGSSNETLEATVTLFGLLSNWNPKNTHLKSTALKDFTKNLKEFNLPLLMIVGEKDISTTPKNCQMYGYNIVKSERKNFILIEKTGHQDILAPKDPTILRNYLSDWLLSF